MSENSSMPEKELNAVLHKSKVIFTTLLIEKSPQALPLGAACVASAVKHWPGTCNIADVELISFCQEDPDFVKACSVPGIEFDDGLEASHVSSCSNPVKISDDLAASFMAARLLEKKPVIVGFSVFVWNRVVLEKTAHILQGAGIKCICGGPEVTANPAGFSYFDFACVGEGEFIVPQVVEKILTGKSCPAPVDGREETDCNTCNTAQEEPDCSTASSVMVAPNSLKEEDYLNLHSPYLDGTLDVSEYEGALWELARGCPFKCSYCYESKGSKSVRMFPMERIDQELELFARKKVPQVFVLDPTYNANKERAIKLINKIAEKTPDTFYYFEARAEFIDKQLAHAFTKIPCALQIGLQSADENVLRLVNRPFNKKAFLKGINFLNQEGAVFGLDVIYGLPGDTLQGFKNTVDFAMSLYPNNLEIFCLSVLPGTDLFDRAAELSLNYEAAPPYHIINTDKFSAADIKKAGQIAKACNVFYNDGRAVPWFNSILHALRIKATDFFAQFYKFMMAENVGDNCKYHKEVEALQKNFVTQIFTQRKMQRLLDVALDIIAFNGAVSRKIDTGVSETVRLNYPAEYIDSEFAMDLDFFVKNVKKRPSKFTT